MDLNFRPEDIEFRREVRTFLSANVPPQLPSVDTRDGFSAHRDWERLLADHSFAAVSWPVELGGRGADLVQWLIFEEEYHGHRGPVRVNQNGLFLLAPTLFTHGTAEQISRILPPMARAEQVWAQAWSEPNAGSDLAAIRSRASRTSGGWLLSGQKTWSTRAVFADRAFGLFRTDPEAGRHRGLTYFMFDLRADGVDVRGIPQLDGYPGFAEIFLDDVFVPDDDVIGAVDDGWRVAMATASSERGLSLKSPGRFMAAAQRLLALAGDSDDRALTDRIVDAWIGARAYQLHTWSTVSRLQGGGHIGSEASLGKIFWSELDVALHETALDALGPGAETSSVWMDGYLYSLAGPIYAGTNEIQRNIVAERLLGLPR